MIDFPTEVLEKLVIGDRIQVRAFGVGLAIEGFPDVLCTDERHTGLRDVVDGGRSGFGGA